MSSSISILNAVHNTKAIEGCDFVTSKPKIQIRTVAIGIYFRFISSSKINCQTIFPEYIYVTLSSNFGKFQDNISHIFQLTVSEGKDLFISACRTQKTLFSSVLNFFFNFNYVCKRIWYALNSCIFT